MPDGVLLPLALYGVVTTAVVVLLWFIQRRTGDAGIIDVAWGAGLAAGATRRSPVTSTQRASMRQSRGASP